MPEANFVDSEIPSVCELWGNLIRNMLLELEVVLPAVVESYDREKNIVTARPAVNRVLTDGTEVQRALVRVPCVNPYGNSIGINFPLKKGDTGWVIASDRDSENFEQMLQVTRPKTGIIHKYDFGFFIPDKVHDFKIEESDADALVIETLDAKTRITLKDKRVTIITDGDVIVNAKDISATASNKISVSCKTAEVTASSSATVTCPATTWTGDITVAGDVIASGISLVHHVHPQTSSSNTLPPI